MKYNDRQYRNGAQAIDVGSVIRVVLRNNGASLLVLARIIDR
jgi:hypothetical protein